MDFDSWYAAVDAVFVERVGLGRDDFPDTCYYDYWEDGLTPSEAFDAALEDGGYGGMM